MPIEKEDLKRKEKWNNEKFEPLNDDKELINTGEQFKNNQAKTEPGYSNGKVNDIIKKDIDPEQGYSNGKVNDIIKKDIDPEQGYSNGKVNNDENSKIDPEPGYSNGKVNNGEIIESGTEKGYSDSEVNDDEIKGTKSEENINLALAEMKKKKEDRENKDDKS